VSILSYELAKSDMVEVVGKVLDSWKKFQIFFLQIPDGFDFKRMLRRFNSKALKKYSIGPSFGQ